jgi:hypothetical protein
MCQWLLRLYQQLNQVQRETWMGEKTAQVSLFAYHRLSQTTVDLPVRVPARIDKPKRQATSTAAFRRRGRRLTDIIVRHVSVRETRTSTFNR